MKPAYKTALLWIGLLLLFIIGWKFLVMEPRSKPVTFHDFRSDVENGRVEEVEIHLKKNLYTYTVRGQDGEVLVKKTIGPVDEKLREDLVRTAPDPDELVDQIEVLDDDVVVGVLQRTRSRGFRLRRVIGTLSNRP